MRLTFSPAKSRRRASVPSRLTRAVIKAGSGPSHQFCTAVTCPNIFVALPVYRDRPDRKCQRSSEIPSFGSFETPSRLILSGLGGPRRGAFPSALRIEPPLSCGRSRLELGPKRVGIELFLESEALAFDVNRDRMMGQPVDDRAGDHGIAEDLAPGVEALIAETVSSQTFRAHIASR